MVPSDSDTPSDKKGSGTGVGKKEMSKAKKAPAVPLSPLQKRPFRAPQPAEETSRVSEETDDSPEETDELQPAAVPTAAVFDGDLADTIRGSFREYVAEHVETGKEGPKKVNIDGEFIRDHGFNVLSNMFQSVIKAVLPEKLEMTVPGMSTTDGEPAEEAADPVVGQEDPAVDDDSVSVNVDVAGLLRTLFTPRTAEAEEETQPPDPNQEDETP